MSGQGLMQLVLLGAACGLAGLLYDELSNPIEPNPVSSGSRATPDLEAKSYSLVATQIAGLESLSATRERPMFSPVRKAPNQATPDVNPQSADSAAIELIGTLTAPQGGRALLRARETQGGVWVGVGDTASGWRIAKIAKDSVIVEAAGRRLELTLYPTKAPNGP